MPVIFISYRRSDSQDVTGRIYDRLVAKFTEKQVFKDVESIPLGVTFPMHISQMIGKASVVLVIIGPGWVTATDEQGRRRLDDPTDFVRIEVESALRANMPVVPVLVGTARMPSPNELAPSLSKLTLRNGMPVRPDPDFNNDIARLVAGIDKLGKLLNPKGGDSGKGKVEEIPMAILLQEQIITETAPDSSWINERRERTEESPKTASQPPNAGDPRRNSAANDHQRKLTDEAPKRKIPRRTTKKSSGSRAVVVLLALAAATVSAFLVWREIDRRRGARIGNALANSSGQDLTTAKEDKPEKTAVPKQPPSDSQSKSSLLKQPTDAQSSYRRGLDLFVKKDYDEAIKEFDEAIKLDPNHRSARYYRGQAWREKKDFDKAIQDFDEAIRINPQSSAYFRARGNAWLAEKEYDKAIKDFNEAIRLNPKYAHGDRGNAWYFKREYDKAIKDYDEEIKLDPKQLSVFFNRGLAWRYKLEYDKAIENYDEVIRLDPKYVNAHYQKACAYALKGRTIQSIDSLRKAFEVGYRDFQKLERDSDLSSIRNDARYKAVLKMYSN